MSTDKPHEQFESRQKYVCSDQDGIEFCLRKVRQYAAEKYVVMYVVRNKGFYWMTDVFVPSGERVALVYPGGRVELGCAYENPHREPSPEGGEN